MNNLRSQKFMTMFNDMLTGKIGSEAQLATALLATSQSGGDEIDLLHNQKEQMINMRLDERNLLYLKKVREAKQKIADGSFGECEDCSSEISERRLIARPTASLCINCQEEKEKEDYGNFNKRRDLSNGKFNEVEADTHISQKKTFNTVNDIHFESVVDF